MIRKLRAIIRLLRCDEYILISRKSNDYYLDLKCSNKMLEGYCPGIHQLLNEQDAAVDITKKIIKQEGI